MVITGQNRSTGTQMSQCHSVDHKSHMGDFNPVLSDDRPLTNDPLKTINLNYI